eukprot:365425-Chlamydomonas_euryale.AAC.5
MHRRARSTHAPPRSLDSCMASAHMRATCAPFLCACSTWQTTACLERRPASSSAARATCGCLTPSTAPSRSSPVRFGACMLARSAWADAQTMDGGIVGTEGGKVRG